MKLEFLKSCLNTPSNAKTTYLHPQFPQMLQFPLWRKYGTSTQDSEMLCRACTNRNMHKSKAEAPKKSDKKHKISLNSPLVIESPR